MSCENQALSATKHCVETACQTWDGDKQVRPELVKRGRFWCCPKCGGSYGEAPHPDLANKFPGIERAALVIAYDNGGINAVRSVDDHKLELQIYLKRRCWLTPDQLDDIDAWLGALSDEDLEIVCAGEDGEMQDKLEGSPPGTNELLTEIFEEVC